MMQEEIEVNVAVWDELLPIKPAQGGGFYIPMIAPGNHAVLLTSEIYTTREHAEEGRATVIRVFTAAAAAALGTPSTS